MPGRLREPAVDGLLATLMLPALSGLFQTGTEPASDAAEPGRLPAPPVAPVCCAMPSILPPPLPRPLPVGVPGRFALLSTALAAMTTARLSAWPVATADGAFLKRFTRFVVAMEGVPPAAAASLPVSSAVVAFVARRPCDGGVRMGELRMGEGDGELLDAEDRSAEAAAVAPVTRARLPAFGVGFRSNVPSLADCLVLGGEFPTLRFGQTPHTASRWSWISLSRVCSSLRFSGDFRMSADSSCCWWSCAA